MSVIKKLIEDKLLDLGYQKHPYENNLFEKITNYKKQQMYTKIMIYLNEKGNIDKYYVCSNKSVLNFNEFINIQQAFNMLQIDLEELRKNEN